LAVSGREVGPHEAVDRAALLDQLASGEEHRFADWPNAELPNWRAGVYTVWSAGEFIYVGMSGRSIRPGDHLADEARAAKKAKGLRDRLGSHASGLRSGDQFCIYVADRLVLPSLTPAQVTEIAAGSLSFDRLVRAFIHEHLTYRYVLVDSGADAFELEKHVQVEGLGGVRPLFNRAAAPRPGSGA
jgi:hypothetical protein